MKMKRPTHAHVFYVGQSENTMLHMGTTYPFPTPHVATCRQHLHYTFGPCYLPVVLPAVPQHTCLTAAYLLPATRQQAVRRRTQEDAWMADTPPRGRSGEAHCGLFAVTLFLQQRRDLHGLSHHAILTHLSLPPLPPLTLSYYLCWCAHTTYVLQHVFIYV